METKSNDYYVDLFSPIFMPEVDTVPCVSRGQVLSGVLNGVAGYDSIPILADCAPGDIDSDIDYDPSNDQRLDRFDGVELGVEAMDDAVAASAQKASSAEKKE